ncbi:MAG: transcription elongation factor GreA [Chromatiales bacterium]|nr:transcription elongation factor GreA [Chromatiales bacterium]
MKKTPMTVRGAEKLREELRSLKSESRPAVIQAISEARAHGDLKENAEYHAAKEQQGFVEGRIREIETKLAEAEVIDVTALNPGGRIVFGTTVELLEEDSERCTRYQIVGDDEADIDAGKISVSSPIARALIGRHAGDEVTVNTPGGERIYEIVKVEYI